MEKQKTAHWRLHFYNVQLDFVVDILSPEQASKGRSTDIAYHLPFVKRRQKENLKLSLFAIAQCLH